MIFLGSDHGGFDLKESIRFYLNSQKIMYEDLGVYNKNISNYSEISELVAKKTVRFNAIGILCCGSGIGVCIAANKIKGARAVLCSNIKYAEISRQHNNANIICLGGRFTLADEAIKMVKIFISTEFEGGRHIARLEYVTKIEENLNNYV
ncbi:MAG: ribose 5-phosphate isomerase B [Candidatus Improbicoccus devescovinae]|nr:MAG: ribose 5-phosphate isomerase B [Candidatus Improbicoccus devescovinae]